MADAGEPSPLPAGPRAGRMWQTLRFGLRPAEFLRACGRRYGDAFTIRIAHEPDWVVMGDPDAIGQVFAADPEVARAGEANAFLRPVLGEGSVVLLDGSEHLRHRRLLLGPLHTATREHDGLIRQVAREAIAGWRDGQRIHVLREMQAITLEVMIGVVLGIDDPAELRLARRRLRRLLWLSTWPPAIAAVGLLGYRLAARHPALLAPRNPVRELIGVQIARRRADVSLTRRSDVLSLLLADGELTDRELLDELFTLLVAGRDTTATALAWTIEQLAHNPAADARLREDLAQGDSNYLDAVIREALRLRPVFAVVARRLASPATIAGNNLPRGIAVAPSIELAHHDERFHQDPQSFLPERYLGDREGERAWIPFGGGTRRCLGASLALTELRIVISELTAQVALTPLHPPQPPRRRAHMLAPRNGVRVIVRRRAPARQAAAGGAGP